MKRHATDEETEESEFDEEEVVDEGEVNRNDGSGNIVTSSLCSYCHASLQPPHIVAVNDLSHPHPHSADLWQHISQDSRLLKEFGFNPSRPPFTEPIHCRTTTDPNHADDGSVPCDEVFCSKQCESRAWSSHHQLEHMTPTDLKRFATNEFEQLMADDHRSEIIVLLMRAIALLRSTTSTPVETSQQKHNNPPLTLLDHLSHLSTLPKISYFTPTHLTTLDRAIGPFLTDVLKKHPHLSLNLSNSSNLTREQVLLRGLLGALIANSFQLIQPAPSLLVSSDSSSSLSSSSPSLSVSPHSPRFDVGEYGIYTHSSAVFSLASFMNHACQPYNNVGFHHSSEEDESSIQQFLHSHGTTVRFAALQTIEPGAELLWCYTPDASQLPIRYGFKCRCDTCTGRRKQKSGTAKEKTKLSPT